MIVACDMTDPEDENSRRRLIDEILQSLLWSWNND